ncbi:MAG: sugar phosphate isomerase/epimerase [Verrucomicrobia bacterium]|nr:sugar phosphate isomerase/epimerase [Verrucomicrobiota bacterium]
MNAITRRDFVKLSTAAALAPLGARAIEPFKRAGKARLQLSLAAYSFREFFKDSTHKRAKEPAADQAIDMFQFIDFCAEHGCDGAELTAYYFPKDVTDAYLLKVRRHAFLRGVAVSGTSVGNNFAHPKGEARDQQIADVKKWIDRAAVMGAPHIRIFAGVPPKGTDAATARAMCLDAIEECCDYAGRHGIFLGLENHGGIVAKPEELLEIVKAVKSPWFGVNLDTGNYIIPDPYAGLEATAPYAVNVQLKVEIKRDPKGANEPSDLPRLVKILRAANYQGYVALEYEAKEDPWTVVPRVLKQMKELFVA